MRAPQSSHFTPRGLSRRVTSRDGVVFTIPCVHICGMHHAVLCDPRIPTSWRASSFAILGDVAVRRDETGQIKEKTRRSIGGFSAILKRSSRNLLTRNQLVFHTSTNANLHHHILTNMTSNAHGNSVRSGRKTR